MLQKICLFFEKEKSRKNMIVSYKLILVNYIRAEAKERTDIC